MGVDLLIKNGKVYTEDGFKDLDIGVIREKIAYLAEPGLVRDEDAGKVIDATGKHVLPGIIDWHSHLREPGFEYKEDYLTGTKAAAHGGVTMVCPQPNLNPVPRTLEAYKLQIELGESKAVVDFHAIPSPLGYKTGEVEKIADYGAAWFKIFQKVDKYPYATPAGTCDTSEILDAFKAVAAVDRWCSVHPWDKWFHDAATQSVRDEGLEMVTENVRPRWYGNEEMAGAMYGLYYLAKKANMKWYAMHSWMPDSIDLVKLAKAEEKIPVIASFELMPSVDVAEFLYDPTIGKWAEFNISHDATPDEKYMWESVMDGTIDLIGTDHAPHAREDYAVLLAEKPEDWVPASLGYPLLDWHGHLMLDRVSQGKLTLEKMVESTSVNGAKAFGFYPNKGSNLPGTDADFSIADMNEEWEITSERVYAKSGYSPYHGRKLKGRVTHTIVRGTVVMENDVVIGEPGFGKFVKAGKK